MIVLDASAAIELLTGTRLGAKVAPYVFDADETLHAPHLIDLEVAQVLRRWELRGLIDETRAALAIDDLNALPLNRYPHASFLARIWALRPNLTAYDAAYVALTEALDATLITFDAAIGRVPGSSAKVVVLR